MDGYHVWGYEGASICKAFATNKNVQLGRPGATYKQKGEAPSETIRTTEQNETAESKTRLRTLALKHMP